MQSNLVNVYSLGLEVLFQIISSSNYREVDIKIYIPPPPKKKKFYHFFLYQTSNISFCHVKETSQ